MMRERLEAIAPYITIFGLFLLVGALYIWQLVDNAPDWLAPAVGVTGLVLMLAWPLFRPQDVKQAAGTRQARHGGNSLALTVAVIGILVVVNFLATRFYYTWDLTSNQRFSLSSQTVQILEDLEDRGQAVRVTAVLNNLNVNAQEIERLTDEYRRRGGTVEFETIDPQLDLVSFQALASRIEEQPPVSGIVAETGTPGEEGYQHAVAFGSFDEQAFTEAILKATQDAPRVVAFTTGHGEYSLEPDAEAGRSLVGISEALAGEGATLETLNLAITDTIAADAVVVAGPERPFQPQEAEALADYVAGGGSVLVLADPEVDTGLEPLLSPWGLTLNDDFVLDPQRSYLRQVGLTAIVGDGYGFHTITKDLAGPDNDDIPTVLPGARSISVAESAPNGGTVTRFLETSDQAWGETDIASLEGANLAPGQDDISGRLAVGVVGESLDDGAEGAEDAGRLVLISSAGLVSDGFFEGLGQLSAVGGASVANGNVVLNAVNWLTLDEELISIRPTEPDDRTMQPPGNPWMLIFVTVLLLPGVVAAIGILIWWRRR